MRTYKQGLSERLKDPSYAKDLLNQVLLDCNEDGDYGAFLLTLQDVAKAQKGVAELSKGIGKKKQTIYKALSKRGNPTLKTVQGVVNSLGYKIQLV